jgi:hypothetical protein
MENKIESLTNLGRNADCSKAKVYGKESVNSIQLRSHSEEAQCKVKRDCCPHPGEGEEGRRRAPGREIWQRIQHNMNCKPFKHEIANLYV